MVIIRRQVNPSLDAWQIRSSQRMVRPFICLINSEPLSIFNHQKGNEINNLMMPATLHTHTHAHTQNNTHKQMSIYRSFDYEHGQRHLQWCMIKLLFMIYQKTGSSFYLMRGSHSLSFNSACSAVSLLNHTVRHGFTLFHKGPGLSFHSSHTSDLNLQCGACVLLLWVSPSPAVPDTHSKHPGPRKADIFTKLC